MMAQVTPENFDTQATRDKYWSLVEWSLTNLFDAPIELAKELRQLTEAAPIGERMLSYNASPLDVAMDLAAEGPLTAEQNAAYNAQEALVLST